MVSQIIEDIKKGFSGDAEKDITYLLSQAIKYRDHPQATEIIKEITELAHALVPEQENFRKSMFIDGKTLERAYKNAVKNMKNNALDDAIETMSKIEAKIDEYFDVPGAFSFRNKLEKYLYMKLFNYQKGIFQTVYDFSKFFSAYGYMLLKNNEPLKAFKVIVKAIRFNPINPEPRFELIEIYKHMDLYEKILNCVREMINIAITPYYLSRCYEYLGCYCQWAEDYDGAMVFYYESIRYAENPAVKYKLIDSMELAGRDYFPDKSEILAVFEKYNIPYGPDIKTLNNICALAHFCIVQDVDPHESLFYIKLVYNFTNDPKLKDTIYRLKAEIIDKELLQYRKSKPLFK